MNKSELMNSFNTNVGLLPIGALAKSLDIHPRTLRIYDQQDILKPQRSEGDRRMYSLNDVEKAKLILFLTRNLALNISGVKIILSILNKIKVEPSQYYTFIQEVADQANINIDVQRNNLTKTSKRGRKPKEKSI